MYLVTQTKTSTQKNSNSLLSLKNIPLWKITKQIPVLKFA